MSVSANFCGLTHSMHTFSSYVNELNIIILKTIETIKDKQMMQNAGRAKIVLDVIQSGNQFVAELYVSDSTITPIFHSNLHFLFFTFFARILRAICCPC